MAFRGKFSNDIGEAYLKVCLVIGSIHNIVSWQYFGIRSKLLPTSYWGAKNKYNRLTNQYDDF